MLKKKYTMQEMSEELGRNKSIISREINSAQTTIEQSNKTKTDFLSNMTYEIKTPMNLIVSLCDELIGMVNFDEKLVDLVATTLGFKKAKEIGMTTFLNPAPAANVDSVLFKYTDVIVPNETELKLFNYIVVFIDELSESDKYKDLFDTGNRPKSNETRSANITVGTDAVDYHLANLENPA